MAAALRLLLRRRAESPSAPTLALLQPLLLRPYSKGCSALLPVRKPTDRGREATQRPVQLSSPLPGVNAASNLLGMQPVQRQPSAPQVPSLIRHYSSKGCATPLPQQPIDPRACQFLEQANYVVGASNNSVKQLALVHKGMKTCVKALDLLDAGVDDDKAFAMFERGLDDALNALAVYEMNLDEVANSSKGMHLDIDLEPYRMACKEIKNSLEYMRKEQKELQRSNKTQKMMEIICRWLEFAYVILGAFVLLMLWGHI